ncbi:hypothetical protein SAMN04488057_10816 [Cyclobacterium lianum]|uniref:Gfo/Idh/MocA-like oxidoreductase N-terminal domain-containing protein n=1 Tax=Cyclobacterium lianum TaxID=388280 RepID=A0A1M7PC60_9BACT|nr:Gfo/Idh/MocA family oxidoreductase [Cyclobacterium lianum]SHN14481.1 hypothetical protein SAMN04488057_10816 [Cyclobacterium lianum]
MLDIGIIGMSPGNAHPYSWSAIINGRFDPKRIGAAGYPAVGDYLQANKDTLGIPGARISHVWTQKREVSEDIARHSGIDHVVDSLPAMIGKVDAVILARDDPEKHVEMAKPFLNEGIPIFVDKPLAFSNADLQYFKDQVHAGKFLMSCSSMRYAHECRTLKTEMKSMGTLQLVTAVGKKDWKKYGVHLLEALFSSLDDPDPLWVQHVGEENKDIVVLGFPQGIQATIHLFRDISSTFQMSFFGSEGWRMAEIKNSYSMFRENLIEFVRSVEAGKPRLEFKKTVSIIRALLGAQESFENGGKRISLK